MSRLMETRTALKLGLMPTVFATVAALYFAQAVLIPLAVAILLGFLLAPVVTWLEQCRVGRISALPPAALAHSRYLCKRLHVKFPKLPTVVGLWTSKSDPKKSLDRLACA